MARKEDCTVTLAEIMAALGSLVLAVAEDLGVYIAAGVIIGGAAFLFRRFARSGR